MPSRSSVPYAASELEMLEEQEAHRQDEEEKCNDASPLSDSQDDAESESSVD